MSEAAKQAFNPQAFIGISLAEEKKIRADWPLTVTVWNRKMCRNTGEVCETVCRCLVDLIEAMQHDRSTARRQDP